MLNCPGRKRASTPSGGSSVSVNVSFVSLSMPTSRPGRGSINGRDGDTAGGSNTVVIVPPLPVCRTRPATAAGSRATDRPPLPLLFSSAGIRTPHLPPTARSAAAHRTPAPASAPGSAPETACSRSPAATTSPGLLRLPRSRCGTRAPARAAPAQCGPSRSGRRNSTGRPPGRGSAPAGNGPRRPVPPVSQCPIPADPRETGGPPARCGLPLRSYALPSLCRSRQLVELLRDVDARRAPCNAAAAAGATRRAELLLPPRQLVSQPLPVTRLHARAHAAAVNVGETLREARVPQPPALARQAVQA